MNKCIQGCMKMSWEPDATTLDELRHFAIQNAIEYNGKANAKSVIGRVLSTRADLRNHAKEITSIISDEVEKANSLASSSGLETLTKILEIEAPHLLEAREKQERRSGLPDLPNATKGKVVLRFAPNPNGPLSVGHARGLVINGTYRDMYEGELILRFDDTDTSVKPPMIEAYAQIEQETKWLTGKAPERVIIASDRMETYYQYAEKMLLQGFGYVCSCSAETFKEFREQQQNCPCRSRLPTENILLWQQMLHGELKPGDVVVRVKTEMALKNPALRDWPALRLQDTDTHPHPRPEIGSRYKVWPLLDFQSAIEDHLQGVTHIIRGKDLMDSTRKQTLLYEHFGWKYPETLYWGRVKIHEWGGFSTSAIRTSIEEGRYSSWDDVRLPTISGIKNRGITAEALRLFWLELGITQKDISVPLATLFAHNTKTVDYTAPRLTFVRNPMQFSFSEHIETLSFPRHPNNKNLGKRIWPMVKKSVFIEKEDAEKHSTLRLKECADVNISGAEIRFLETNHNHEKLPIVHWLPEDVSCDCTLLYSKDDEIHAIMGKSERHEFPSGTIVQLERIGYAKVVDDSTFFLSYED
jgi:glutamyl-tRNA synthetase